MSPAPAFRLTTPARLTIHAGTAGRFPVTNGGSSPLRITVTTGRLNPLSQHYPSGGRLVVSPARFTLAPHHTIMVALNADHAGSGYRVILFRAAPVGHGATVTESGAVGTSVKVVGAHAPPATLPLRPTGHGGIIVAGAAVLALVIVPTLLWAFLLRRRHHTARHA